MEALYPIQAQGTSLFTSATKIYSFSTFDTKGN